MIKFATIKCSLFMVIGLQKLTYYRGCFYSGGEYIVRSSMTKNVVHNTQALRDVRINVPSAVIRGDDAILECFYDLEGEQLYTVKWYLGNTEFCTYTPKEIPPIKQFRLQNGLMVRANDSNGTRVVLEHVPTSVSGKYTCEVSADAPSFFTLVQSGNLQVVDLPRKDPYISGIKTRYHHGDMLRANCTSEYSNPAANLSWYINGIAAEPNHVKNFRQKAADGSHTSHSVLRMKITKQSFLKHRLKIRCVARMFDIYYRSNEKSVEPEKRRNRHFVQSTFSTILLTTTVEPPWELAQAQPETRYINNDSTGGGTKAQTPFMVVGYCAILIITLLR